MRAVIVYNMGGTEQLDTVSVKQAITMIHRGVARIHSTDPEGDRFGPYERPTAIELTRYIFAKWLYMQTGATYYSKSGILRRDNYTCAYCGRTAKTIDHVKPRCQGGLSTWENTVAACLDCNARKGGRTPAQAGMKLQWQPFVPTVKQAYGLR
jgi:hypothetical protein